MPNVVSLPADIAPLVQRVYAVDEDLPLEPLGYKKMKADFLRSIADKENKASAFRLANVQRDETIHKLLKNSTNVDGEAKVRDAEQSFEILMVQKMHNGMTIIGEKESIPTNLVPSSHDARRIARQSIRLPNVLCREWNVNTTIMELEEMTMKYLRAWQESPWLKGELFLILDDNLQASLSGYRLKYDLVKGLMYEKEGGNE